MKRYLIVLAVVIAVVIAGTWYQYRFSKSPGGILQSWIAHSDVREVTFREVTWGYACAEVLSPGKGPLQAAMKRVDRIIVNGVVYRIRPGGDKAAGGIYDPDSGEFSVMVGPRESDGESDDRSIVVFVNRGNGIDY